MESDSKLGKLSVLESTQGFFSEVVGEALQKRKLATSPLVSQYLVQLLESYLFAEKLEVKTTMAEMLLRANQAEKTVKQELLRKLGDTSLYISGFFGDSLKRKIVDIDYYADIGGMAYGQLAMEFSAQAQAQIFDEFSQRFLDYVDLLTYISQNAFIQSNQDLLRLYERYVTTGSELARDQLLEKGLLTTEGIKKSTNQ